MMSSIYETIGRLVVRGAWARYGRQITLVGVVVGAAALAGLWALATREPPEG